MIMKNYRTFLIAFFVLLFNINLFADINNKKVKQLEQIEDGSITYLGLQKEAPKHYRVTGQYKKDKEYNDKMHKIKEYNVNGIEENSNVKASKSYDITGVFNIGNKVSRIKNKGIVYHITGMENKFRVDDSKKTFNVTGTEIMGFSDKLIFTKYQKAQLEYLEMEREYKILAIDKEISSRQKMIDEELSKEYFDVFFIDELTKEIKILTVDKTTVNINVDKKIRYVLSPEQYTKYKQKQNKKNKKKK